MIFFTSDWHLGHVNILKYDNRPFKTIEEHDKTIIDNCNKLVKKDDILVIAGDLTMGYNVKVGDIYNVREKINCSNIHYILGNHDKTIQKNRYELIKNNVFLSILDVNTFKWEDKKIFVSHYAHRVWNGSHYGVWHLYGHSHGSLADDPNSFSFDIGVNCHNYFPLDFYEIANIMKEKTFVPVDHHV